MTPIEGLYACGVSTYPGGLVLGRPGYLRGQQGGRGPGRQEVVETDAGDGEVRQDVFDVKGGGFRREPLICIAR